MGVMKTHRNPRPLLTDEEWKRLKVKAAQAGVSIGDYTAAALRDAMRGAKT